MPSSTGARARCLWLAGMLLASAGPGCKCSGDTAVDAEAVAPSPSLGTFTVQDRTPDGNRPGEVTLDTGALERRGREVLAGAGLFVPVEGDAGTAVAARARVEVAIEDVQVEDKAAARALVHLRIDTRPSGVAAPRWHEDVQAGAEVIYTREQAGDRPAVFQKLVTRTLEDLLAAYVARQKLWTADLAIVRKTLQADGGDLRLEAIRLVGEKRLTSEVPTLLKLLGDADETVRDAALGALVEMRERRAVSVLAEQRSMRDRREMRKILDAMALLGGDEAADYLGFVADGHDDPEIRQMAQQARERLERRASPREPERTP